MMMGREPNTTELASTSGLRQKPVRVVLEVPVAPAEGRYEKEGAELPRLDTPAASEVLLVRVLDCRRSVLDRGATFVGRGIDVHLGLLLVAFVEFGDGLKVVVRRCDVPGGREMVLFAGHVGVGLGVSHDAFLRIGDRGQSNLLVQQHIEHSRRRLRWRSMPRLEPATGSRSVATSTVG